MKLYAKILPKYFEQIKDGEKSSDYRQFETITFYNSETAEEIEIEVQTIIGPVNRPFAQRMRPDVKWDPDKPIFQIKLGRRL